MTLYLYEKLLMSRFMSMCVLIENVYYSKTWIGWLASLYGQSVGQMAFQNRFCCIFKCLL